MLLKPITNRPTWDIFFADQNTQGLDGIRDVRLTAVSIPEEIATLDQATKRFWTDLNGETRAFKNGRVLATTGDTQREGDTLVIPVFEAPYALSLLKMSELAESRYLSPEALRIFKDNFFLVGVGAYARDQQDRYLCGKTKSPFKKDLWENVPQGTVDLGRTCAEQIYAELDEETGLRPEHVAGLKITHLNRTPLYSSFTIINELELTPYHPTPRRGPEHSAICWKGREEIIGRETRYNFNPVTVALVEKLSE